MLGFFKFGVETGVEFFALATLFGYKFAVPAWKKIGYNKSTETVLGKLLLTFTI